MCISCRDFAQLSSDLIKAFTEVFAIFPCQHDLSRHLLQEQPWVIFNEQVFEIRIDNNPESYKDKILKVARQSWPKFIALSVEPYFRPCCCPPRSAE